jgi:hypothetical protein
MHCGKVFRVYQGGRGAKVEGPTVTIPVSPGNYVEGGVGRRSAPRSIKRGGFAIASKRFSRQCDTIRSDAILCDDSKWKGGKDKAKRMLDVGS